MYKIDFFVGTTTQQNAEISSQTIVNNLKLVIRANYPDGHTFTDVNGGWVNAAGEYIAEPSIIVTVMCSDIEKARQVKNTLADVCYQDSILMIAAKLEICEF